MASKELQKLIEISVYRAVRKLLLDEKILEGLLESTVRGTIKYLNEMNSMGGGLIQSVPSAPLQISSKNPKQDKLKDKEEEQEEEQESVLGSVSLSSLKKSILSNKEEAKKITEEQKIQELNKKLAFKNVFDDLTMETYSNMDLSSTPVESEENIRENLESLNGQERLSAYDKELMKESVSEEQLYTLFNLINKK